MKTKTLWILIIAVIIATSISVFWDIVKTAESSVWIGIGIALVLSALLIWISSCVMNKQDRLSGSHS